jgi:uncharacterized membrane protein YedE/YeeE
MAFAVAPSGLYSVPKTGPMPAEPCGRLKKGHPNMALLTELAASPVVHDLTRAALGGVLIGLAAGVLMLANGRIAGISGLFGGLLGGLLAGWPTTWKEDLLFLAGLPLGAVAFSRMGGTPQVTLAASPWLLLGGGLLVGFGTRLGGGCTSGHAVCGLARLSPRSIVATALFMAAAMATVAAGRLL